MTSDRRDPLTPAQAWSDRVAYHRDRAVQETLLAERSQTEAGRAAHHLLADRHRQMMRSAELAMTMADPEMPESTSLHMTGWLMRQSYGDQD